MRIIVYGQLYTAVYSSSRRVGLPSNNWKHDFSLRLAFPPERTGIMQLRPLRLLVPRVRGIIRPYAKSTRPRNIPTIGFGRPRTRYIERSRSVAVDVLRIRQMIIIQEKHCLSEKGLPVRTFVQYRT